MIQIYIFFGATISTPGYNLLSGLPYAEFLDIISPVNKTQILDNLNGMIGWQCEGVPPKWLDLS